MWLHYREGGLLVTWHQLANPFNMTGLLLSTRSVLHRREVFLFHHVTQWSQQPSSVTYQSIFF